MFWKKKSKVKNQNIDYVEKKFQQRLKNKIEKFLFWSLVIFVIISFFGRNNFRTVKNPDPALFEEPKKSALLDSELIEFSEDGFDFILTPLYEYEMSVLVVNRFDYTWFSLTRADSAIPMDLCVTWGDNVENGAFRHSSVSFRQDFRFCIGSWERGANFSWAEVSNNHLIIKDPDIRKKAMSIIEGDQIRLKGKLVNLKAENKNGKTGKYEAQTRNWNSSIKLGDSGAGACEVILVEDLEIIKKGNPIFFYGFKISSLMLAIFVGWKIILFFWEILRNK